MSSSTVNDETMVVAKLPCPERPMKKHVFGIGKVHVKSAKENEVLTSCSSGDRVPVKKPIYVCEDKEACLYAHNKLRSFHGVQSLHWNARLAKDAQNWAVYLMETDLCKHDNCFPDGENLYDMPCGKTFSRVYQAVHMFYSEIPHYHFEEPRLYEQSDSAFCEVGHFSQIVWKDTNKIGCCVAYDKDSTRTVIVCRYHTGQGYDFTDEVEPQIKQGCTTPYVPEVEDLVCENDVTPTLQRVDHYYI